MERKKDYGSGIMKRENVVAWMKQFGAVCFKGKVKSHHWWEMTEGDQDICLVKGDYEMRLWLDQEWKEDIKLIEQV